MLLRCGRPHSTGTDQQQQLSGKDSLDAYDLLRENQVKAVLCDDIDAQLCAALEEDGYDVIVECKGNPLENVRNYLNMDEDGGCSGDCAHCSDESCSQHQCDGNCESCQDSTCNHKH